MIMAGLRRFFLAIPVLLAGLAVSAAAYATADSWVLQPDSQLVGEVGVIAARQEETLTDIARVHGLGYEEIVWANQGVDIWLPGEGTLVSLPNAIILPVGAQRCGGQYRRVPAVLLSPDRRQAGRVHISGQHRTHGLVDTDRSLVSGRQTEGSCLVSARVDSQGTSGGWPGTTAEGGAGRA